MCDKTTFSVHEINAADKVCFLPTVLSTQTMNLCLTVVLKNDLHLIEDGLELVIKTFLPDHLCLWQLVFERKDHKQKHAHMVTLEVAVNIGFLDLLN